MRHIHAQGRPGSPRHRGPMDAERPKNNEASAAASEVEPARHSSTLAVMYADCAAGRRRLHDPTPRADRPGSLASRTLPYESRTQPGSLLLHCLHRTSPPPSRAPHPPHPAPARPPATQNQSPSTSNSALLFCSFFQQHIHKANNTDTKQCKTKSKVW